MINTNMTTRKVNFVVSIYVVFFVVASTVLATGTWYEFEGDHYQLSNV